MRIAVFTNVYPPLVGGVERSVESTAGALRALGHDVLVVAPRLAGAGDDTGAEIFRVPSLERFAGTGFALPLPAGDALVRRLDVFAPQVIHAHHPFLLGNVALHEATARRIPIAFTYHTRYELLAGPESQGVAGYQRVVLRVAQSLALGYCDLCDGVVAPSQGVARFLRDSGVETAISVIPTGIDTERFQRGDRAGFRARHGLEADAFVVGHVGRLAPEKNLSFLVDGVCAFLAAHRNAWFVLVGSGPMDSEVAGRLREHGVADRAVVTGTLWGPDLADAYRAMDVFAFASRSETQGLVVAEAMAAGLPVVCLDAPGVGEIVVSGVNGLKLPAGSDPRDFAAALGQLARSDPRALAALRDGGRRSAGNLSLATCAGRLADLYARLCASVPQASADDRHRWAGAVARFSDDLRNTATQAWSLGRAILPELSQLGKDVMQIKRGAAAPVMVLAKEPNMTDFPITIAASQPFAFVTRTTRMDLISQAIGDGFARLNAAFAEAGIQAAGPPLAHYVAYDGNDTTFELGFPVAADDVEAVVKAGLQVGRTPEGEIMQALHIGPYDAVTSTYNAMAAQFTRQGLSAGTDMWERYLSPPSTPPAEIRTEILWPVSHAEKAARQGGKRS